MKTYAVYYQLPGAGFTFFPREDLTVANLEKTHVLVKKGLRASSKDAVFTKMQAENWSPQGQAASLIQSLGLQHTSMSVNDVLRDPQGQFWQCMFLGWRQIN
jgi:hypothetical protein